MLLADVAGTNSGEAAARAEQIRRGNSFVSRIRDVVDQFNDFQELAEMAFDAFGGMGGGDDLLLQFLSEGQARLAGGLNNQHHPIPKFMGGDKYGQNMVALDVNIHREFHADLDGRLRNAGLLGGRGGVGNSTRDWSDLFSRRGGGADRISAMRELLRSSMDIDRRHGGNGFLTASVLRNFLGGRGGPNIRP